MSSVQKVDQANFEKAINSNKVVLVDFYADWCGPCKILSPELEKLALAKPEMKLIKVDTDKNVDLAKKLGITGLPTVKLYVDGQNVGTIVGYRPQSELLKFVGLHV